MDKPAGALAGLVGDYGSDSSGDEAASYPVSCNLNPEPIWSLCMDPGSGFPYYWEQVSNTVSWEPPPGVIVPPAAHLMVAAGMVPLQMAKTTGAPIKHKKPSAPAKVVNKSVTVKPSAESSSEEEDERIELITSYHNSGSDTDEDETKRKSVIGVYPANAKHKAKKKLVQKSDIEVAKKINTADNKQYGPQLPKKLNNLEKFGPELPKQVDLSNNITKPVCGPELPSDFVFSVTEKKPAESLVVSNEMDGKLQNGDSLNNIAVSGYEIKTSVERNSLLEKDNSNGCMNPESDNLEDLMEAKTKLLQKLGNLVPSEIQYLVGSPNPAPLSENDTPKRVKSPKTPPGSPPPPPKTTAALDMDVDDLIAQIEKEQPIDQPLVTSDASETIGSVESTSNKSPTSHDDFSQPKSDLPFKPLFPCVNNIDNCSAALPEAILPSSEQIKVDIPTVKPANESVEKPIDNKVVNKYEPDLNELEIENTNFKRKRRIALDVLPKKQEPVPVQNLSYTTKYGESYGVTAGRMGLGFQPSDNEDESKKSASLYSGFKKGGIMFQKGESLNPTLDDEETDNENNAADPKALEEKKNLIEAKLKFLTQSFPPIPPLQQLHIEMQAMWNISTSGNVMNYFDNWIKKADEELQRLEAGAAPPNWTCTFSSESGCYVYQHIVSGERTTQYPLQATPEGSVAHLTATSAIAAPEDMDICTTPPPILHNNISPMPQGSIQNVVFSSIPASEPLPPGTVSPPPPPPYSPPPPPPTPPPPPPPPLSPPPVPRMSPEPPPAPVITQVDMLMANKTKKSTNKTAPLQPTIDPLHAALDSFYSDLASLDSMEPSSTQESSEPQPPPPNILPKQSTLPFSTSNVSSEMPAISAVPVTVVEDQSMKVEKKKKSKSKSSSYHHRGVTNLVAKWKKVQESLD